MTYLIYSYLVTYAVLVQLSSLQLQCYVLTREDADAISLEHSRSGCNSKAEDSDSLAMAAHIASELALFGRRTAARTYTSEIAKTIPIHGQVLCHAHTAVGCSCLSGCRTRPRAGPNRPGWFWKGALTVWKVHMRI